MAKVTIYTRAFCPFCTRALKLLRDKQADFEEIDAGMDAGLRAEMMQRSGGGRTYPQILIGDAPIGGCDDLFALDRQGKLDAMLAAA
ncbi:MAG: glutaredoxin 3 [Pseudomonadota bacterium]